MDDMDAVVMTHFSSAMLVVWALEALKGWTKVPWVAQHTKALNRALSAVVAFFIAAGLTVTGDASIGWTVGIPPLAVLAGTVVDWLHQLASQQFLYMGFVERGAKAANAKVGTA